MSLDPEPKSSSSTTSSSSSSAIAAEAHQHEAAIASKRRALLASVAAYSSPSGAGGLQDGGFVQPAWLKFGGMYARPPADATPELLAAVNCTSNQVHSLMDLTFGSAAYTLGTLMVFAGQSNPFTFMSMWGAGTYMIALSQMRHVRGGSTEIQTGEAWCTTLWFLASFRQFREYRTLKWAGYASWSGLFLCMYYVGRALVANLGDEKLGHTNARKFQAGMIDTKARSQ